MREILITDPDALAREQLLDLLESQHKVCVASCAGEALELMNRRDFDLVVADMNLSRQQESQFLKVAREVGVILTTAFGTIEDAVQAMQDGAIDFLTKPFSDEQITLAIERALETRDLLQENQNLREALDDRLRMDNMIATDAKVQSVFKQVKAVAKTRTTVLVTGESGTGKTLLARAIHSQSGRSNGPFIEVNCGALPESLLESELFGHVRGAFTGAVKDRPGKFELANEGTIFLDEIGTSSPAFQVKLLRVLQDRVLERVGGTEATPVDVRVILATNQDLTAEVSEGRFREDLYYRINVVAVEMPPLRERPADISLLAENFLRRFTRETGKNLRGFDKLAMDQLIHAQWPGNVRQLENVIERAVVLTENQIITPEDLPAELNNTASDPMTNSTDMVTRTDTLPLKKALEAPEKLIIQQALDRHGRNRQDTARSLEINRSTLFNKMRKYGLL